MRCSESSKQQNEQRLKVLAARQRLIKDVFESAKAELKKQVKSSGGYQDMLATLLCQVRACGLELPPDSVLGVGGGVATRACARRGCARCGPVDALLLGICATGWVWHGCRGLCLLQHHADCWAMIVRACADVRQRARYHIQQDPSA